MTQTRLDELRDKMARETATTAEEVEVIRWELDVMRELELEEEIVFEVCD